MDDLLKEAIADAKAVRETALENAKIALEEAFTPRLQSMLSKKIQSEMEDDEDMEDKDPEEAMHDEDEDMEDKDPEETMHNEERPMNDDDEDPSDDHSDKEEDMDMGDEEEDDEKEMDMEGVIEIDGVQYAPVVSEEDVEERGMMGKDDEEPADEDLDLEAVIRELESELDEEEDDDDMKAEEKEMDEEVDATTGIGSSDNKAGSADKSSGIGSKDKAKFTEEVEEAKEEVEEDIDLEEVLKALSEEEDEDDEKNEVQELQSELDEHRNVVKYLRSKLNEVNLLNAKLLFTNKLFRSHGLSNEQKMKVVETFDRATNLREVKLVYSTLAESFGAKQTKTEIKESKGSASKPVASTKSKKQEVIAEGHEMRDRFKKLAGIL